MTWLVSRYKEQIHEGDQCFLWRAGAEAGIVGIATITTDPQPGEYLSEERRFIREEGFFAGPRVQVHLYIDQKLKAPLERAKIKEDPRLSQLSILKNPKGTNFLVTTSEAVALMELIDVSSSADTTPTEAPVFNDRRVWVIAPGRDAVYWDEFYRDGLIAIGWDDLGDLQQYTDLGQLTSRMKEIYESEREPVNNARACFEFSRHMQPGDLVFAKKGTKTIVGYGTISGPYKFEQWRVGFKHTRKVQWQGRGRWEYDGHLPTKTLTNWTPYTDEIEKLSRLVSPATAEIEALPRQEALPPFHMEDALKDLFLNSQELENMLELWRSKKNMVLQGPPGVGKTFVAKRLAYLLMERKDPSRLSMVQFHPSYSYEDFVQGYRPNRNGGFEVRDGLFYSFCQRAKADHNSTYVFIIDEINRGNLSKIFGELLMLIEHDKRDSEWSMPLTYFSSDQQQFHIPENLYLLGLMNTADRSLALVDYALRRRFAFVDLTPKLDSPGFRAYLADKRAPAELVSKLVERITALNNEIRKDRDLGPGYMIGHSYFCNGHQPWSFETYCRIIRNEVIPLLAEYWPDDEDRRMNWRDRLLAGLQ